MDLGWDSDERSLTETQALRTMADALTQDTVSREFNRQLSGITRNAWRRFCVTGYPTTTNGGKRNKLLITLNVAQICLGHSSSEIKMLRKKLWEKIL